VVIEEIVEQLNDATQGGMADEDQGNDQLGNPGLGNRKVEENSVALLVLRRTESVIEGLVGKSQLLVNELSTDVVLLGQERDRLTAKGSQSNVQTLLPGQVLGGTTIIVICGRVVINRGLGYDAHRRDLRLSRSGGSALDLLDPGFFSSFLPSFCPFFFPVLLPDFEPSQPVNPSGAIPL
jgi:hypothetical protein